MDDAGRLDAPGVPEVRRAQRFWMAVHALRAYTFTPNWLPDNWRRPLVGYAGALLAAIAGAELAHLLVVAFPSFGFSAAPSLVAIVGVALTWGLAPALSATLLSVALLDFYVVSPRLSLGVGSATGVAELAVALGSGIVLSIVASQAEARRRQLAAERTQLSTIVDLLPDVLTVWDRQGRVVRVNRATSSGLQVGTTLPQLGQRVDLRTLHGDPLPIDQSPVARALRGEPSPSAEVILTGTHGQDRFLLIQAATVRDTRGEITGAITLSHDFTALHRAEQQAAARAAQFEALSAELAVVRDQLQRVLDVLPVGVMVADATPRFLICNAAARDILGADVTGLPVPLTAEEWPRGPTIWRLDGTPWPIPELPLQRALLRGEVVRGEQLVVRHAASGREVPILADSAPLHDETGSVSGAVSAFQDIAALKDLERQRDELLATVSHDLKNPLTTIVGMSQLLQRRTDSIPAADRARFTEGLGRVVQTAQGMSRQISALLDTTRLQMGRPLELEQRPTDLAALLARLVDEYRSATERHTFQLEGVDAPLVALLDEARLERALSNVLGNALKYSPDGGPIGVALHRTEDESGTRATIEIGDRGIGIPPAELSRVLERFYRASNVVGRIEGTGLGLAGVRQIVEQHGGTLTIDSVLGSGTTVSILLPIVPPPIDAST